MCLWVTDWLASWLAGWLAAWLADWLVGWMTEWLTDWPTDWLNWIIYLWSALGGGQMIKDSETSVHSWLFQCFYPVSYWVSAFSFQVSCWVSERLIINCLSSHIPLPLQPCYHQYQSLLHRLDILATPFLYQSTLNSFLLISGSLLIKILKIQSSDTFSSFNQA